MKHLRFVAVLLLAFAVGLLFVAVVGTLLGACSDGGGDPIPSSSSSSSATSTASSTSSAGGGGGTSSSITGPSSSSAGGAGGHPDWQPNCIGAASDGDPATGCDDGNPCTEDHVADAGGCVHLVIGVGFPCSGDDHMQCWGGECCPVLPWTCKVEGEQGDCAAGSVCFEGRCWIGCEGNASACAGTEFPTCAKKAVGIIAVEVCE